MVSAKRKNLHHISPAAMVRNNTPRNRNRHCRTFMAPNKTHSAKNRNPIPKTPQRHSAKTAKNTNNICQPKHHRSLPKQPRNNPRPHTSRCLRRRIQLCCKRPRTLRRNPLHSGNNKRQIRVQQHPLALRQHIL